MKQIEDKLLDKQYLDAVLNMFSEIKNGTVVYFIRKSDRQTSRTLYLDFCLHKGDNRRYKGATLRISDHSIEKVNAQIQFVVKSGKILSRKRKQQFMAVIDNCIKIALQRYVTYEIHKQGDIEI